MREIKFRAKDVDNNKWIYGNYLHLHKTTYCTLEDRQNDKDNDIYKIVYDQITDWGLPNKHLMVDVKSETVGQYTEFYDKKGKGIYEGDIVKYKDKLFQIIGGWGCFGIATKYDIIDDLFEDAVNDNFYPLFMLYGRNDSNEDFIFNDLEIIGNIYENKDLLEEV